MHPVKWLHAADACDTAAKALNAYADTVEWAQGKARDAIDLYKKATHASEQARQAYNKHVMEYDLALLSPDKDPGPRPGDFHDPATADFQHAKEILDGARKQRDTAAGIAAEAVQTALAHAPAEPPPLAQLKVDAADGFDAFNTEAVHVGGGVIKGTAGLLSMSRSANPLDLYNLTHPPRPSSTPS